MVERHRQVMVAVKRRHIMITREIVMRVDYAQDGIGPNSAEAITVRLFYETADGVVERSRFMSQTL